MLWCGKMKNYDCFYNGMRTGWDLKASSKAAALKKAWRIVKRMKKSWDTPVLEVKEKVYSAGSSEIKKGIQNKMELYAVYFNDEKWGYVSASSLEVAQKKAYKIAVRLEKKRVPYTEQLLVAPANSEFDK